MFKIQINRHTIIYILLLIPFFKPTGPTYYSNVNTIYQIWKLISLLIIVLNLAVTTQSKLVLQKKYFGIIGFIIFGIIYIFNGIRFSTPIGNTINNLVTDILLFTVVIKNMSKQNRKDFINALDFIFSLLIIFQIISVFYINSGHAIFEPIENDYVYFLGTDNYSAFATLPMIGVLLFISHFQNGKKTKNYILLLGLLVTNLYTMSVTALLSFGLLTLFLMLYHYWNLLLKIFSVKRLLIFMMAFLGSVMFLDIQNHFSYILTNWFGKGYNGITLNSRTYIWAGAWNLIKAHPIWGNGQLSENIVSSYTLYGASHAHNILLELLMKTGIIGTICFINFIFYPLKSKRPERLKFETKILNIILISFLILSVMDTYPLTQYQYVLYALIYWWHDYSKQ